MAKYLYQLNYVGEGVKGLIKDGGTKRREVAKKAVESLGGTMESLYYAFGEYDVYVIADMPDHATAANVSLVVKANGFTGKTTVLLTPEDIDEAAKKSPNYTPPGQ